MYSQKAGLSQGNIKSFLFLLIVVIAISCRNGSDRPADQAESNAWPVSFELGRTARQSEIDSLDKDVRPDGVGLPGGSGDAVRGRVIYLNKCAHCHGRNGTEGPFSKLVSLDNDEKAIGNYWPYATTLYDYINRAMPYDKPGSLSSEEVYHLTAFLLYKNNLIDSLFSVDQTTLPSVVMPARDLFVNDDRQGGPEIR